MYPRVLIVLVLHVEPEYSKKCPVNVETNILRIC